MMALITVAAVLVAINANQVAAEQVELTEQGQHQERFDRAVERLGDEAITARTGAVLALDRLVVDAPAFRVPTEDLLARFVRDRAPLSDCAKPQPMPSDVQTALTTIGRHHAGPDKSSNTYPLDLRFTCLAGADLSGADFTRANFGGSDLSSTVLNGTNFTAAYLLKANLTDAQMTHTTFRCATIVITDFTGAWLVDVDMSKAEIMAPNFTKALFVGVNFDSAGIFDVNLTAEQSDEVLGQPSRREMCWPPEDYGPAFAY